MLDIMCDFHDFCEEHDLKYCLDAGTLLGAVRHKGFIPWDNDMDVCMLRPDYDKLLDIVKETGNYINDHLIIELPQDTLYPFIKIGDIRTRLVEYPDTYPEECYIYIDVFPKDAMDGLNRRNKAICKRCYTLSHLQAYYKHTIPKWKTLGGVKKVIASIADFFIKDKNAPVKKKEKLIRKYLKKHPYESGDLVTTLVLGEYWQLVPKKCFENRVLMEFEGVEFWAPEGYDIWLRALYKDTYMQLPPEADRRIHNVITEWKQ